MVQVNVAEGTLEGEVLSSVLGYEYCSFKGIPYAEPPLGELRFKAPVPPKPWQGVRSAKEHGPYCIQHDIATSNISGSEDCLYLNVYTKSITPTEPFPVMVLIHGGGFWCGSGNSDHYGPDFLVDKDVILVTINYRLDVIGFLSLDTEDIPGNAGMKDQVAALRWVKSNIAKFGGDPNNVTLFGESAGGASVSFHLISPMSKGLFKRAIVQSGVASCYWANSFEPRERAIALARKMGKQTSDDKELYEFFKALPVEQLVGQKPHVTLAEKSQIGLEIFFNVASEKKFGENERFCCADVNEALRNGIHDDVDVIFGYAGDEGLIGFVHHTLDDIIEKSNNFLESFVPRVIAINCPIKKQLEVGRKMKKFYYGNEVITKDNLDPLIQYFAMDMFTYDILQWVKKCALKNRNNVYLYKFNYWSERNNFQSMLAPPEATKGRKIACHGEDIMYLFDTKFSKLDLKANSCKMIDNMTTLWTNFAKDGNPTPERSLVEWAPYTLKKQQYLDIDDDICLKTAPEQSELEFWESVMNEYLP